MRLFGVRVPGMGANAVDLQYFGDMPGIPSYESEKRDFDDSPAHSEKAGAWLTRDVLGATDLAAYDADKAEVDQIRAKRPDLITLSDAELRARLVSFGNLLTRLFQHHIEASLKAGVGLGAMGQFTAAIGQPELALTLVSGIGDVDSMEPSIGMYTLSRAARQPAVAALFDRGPTGLYERLKTSDAPSVVAFVTDFDRFLADWDFRGPSEWEIHADTWGVRPDLALGTIDRIRHAGDEADPRKGSERGAAERDATVAEIRAALAGNAEAAGQFEAILSSSALWLRGRERGRTTAAKLMHELRLVGLSSAAARSSSACSPTRTTSSCSSKMNSTRSWPTPRRSPAPSPSASASTSNSSASCRRSSWRATCRLPPSGSAVPLLRRRSCPSER